METHLLGSFGAPPASFQVRLFSNSVRTGGSMEMNQNRDRPFRFLASWLLHEDFSNVVQSVWCTGTQWNDAVNRFHDKIKTWNRDVFGDIFKRKRRLMNRLNGIQRKLAEWENPNLSRLQAQLWSEYEEVLNQEELMWMQKSRSQWIVEGDRNTRFFHTTTMIRRRRNKIEALKDSNGNWVYDSTTLKQMSIDFFSNLYRAENESLPIYEIRGCFPEVSQNELSACSRHFSLEEIKEAIFSMGPFKAPGPDGLSPVFFQSQWEAIKQSIYEMISTVYCNPSMIESINQTLIVLIPKVTNPECLRDMRPISLCNVVYKVITKILANRIKALMPKLVAPNQCSFVPGRHSADNIVVVQEVIHSMRNMRGKKGFMAIKIDLEKAYDRIDWAFVLDTLKDVGLGEKFVSIIQHCLGSASMQLLWNGDKTDRFTPSRGIRQGDLISPYLFVLCMERLAHGIQMAIANGDWRPIKLGREGPPISHLFFADDLIIFTEASIDQVEVVKRVLDDFCSCSGQKVNASKTKVFFSRNVCHTRVEELSQVLGFAYIGDLGKYLGVPILHQRINKDTYSYILERTRNKLSTWKSNCLSLAGRATLIKSVTAAIPIHSMHSAVIPVSVCSELEKINRSFLWGDSTNHRKIHMVSWNKVCSPKRIGGLGMRRMKEQNNAFMNKLGWGLVEKKDALWSRVLRSKYKCGSSIIPSVTRVANSSSIWRGVVNNWKHVQKSFVWRIGNGVKTRFWSDPWVSDGKILREVAFGPLSVQELEAKVSEFVTASGCWDWSKFEYLLPNEVCCMIANIVPPSNLRNEDTVAWRLSKDGKFSTKSAYHAIVSQQERDNVKLWSLIWKWQGMERIRSFLWLCGHDRLLTNAARKRRKLTECDLCPRCKTRSEDLLHMLRDCEKARTVWLRLVKPCHWNSFFRMPQSNWLEANLSSQFGRYDEEWSAVFATTCWFIWKMRNTEIFDPSNHSASDPIFSILHMVRTAKNAYDSALSKQKGHPQRIRKHISWSRPEPGWVKVNVDGARKEQEKIAACGGVARDEHGSFIAGFMRNLGDCNIITAELWGIANGLKMAWRLGFKHVILEADSRTAVDMIHQTIDDSHPCASLVQVIHYWVSQD